MEYIKAFKNLLFPTRNTCYFCRQNVQIIEQFICDDCRAYLEEVHKEVDMDSIYMEKAYYALIYSRLARDMVKDFKFHGKSYLYRPFGEIMMETIKEHSIHNNIHIIFFVPSHRRKEAIRGYNQSELLAKYISKSFNIPMSNNNLIKTKHTKDQNKLSKQDRLTNLDKVFKLKNRDEVKDKNILLIDDIITTGTTMIQCAKILIENGAKEVRGLALTSSKKI